MNILLQTPSSFPNGAAVFAGPYYSYKFSGNQANSQLDFKNIYHRNEAGINYGVELRLSSIRFGVTLRQELTNFTRSKNEDGAYIRNRSFFTTLGYVF